MTASSGDWLFSELERAAEEYESMPEWARPVVTVPYTGSQQSTDRRIGFAVDEPADRG